jgi:hypothetical protein
LLSFSLISLDYSVLHHRFFVLVSRVQFLCEAFFLEAAGSRLSEDFPFCVRASRSESSLVPRSSLPRQERAQFTSSSSFLMLSYVFPLVLSPAQSSCHARALIPWRAHPARSSRLHFVSLCATGVRSCFMRATFPALRPSTPWFLIFPPAGSGTRPASRSVRRCMVVLVCPAQACCLLGFQCV